MSGETNLATLLKSARPEHNPGNFVFCQVANLTDIRVEMSKVVLMFKEKEATTLILEQRIADELSLEYASVFAWITLTIHSSLDAVGLTAAFATALAKENVSCNVVAAYYHDHIFVGTKDLEKSMLILQNL